MTKIPIDDVLRVLRCAPQGMTTGEVADKLSLRPSHIGSRLAKLADYGRIEREASRCACGHRYYRWRMKDDAHA